VGEFGEGYFRLCWDRLGLVSQGLVRFGLARLYQVM
jgi:hypothetical protein